MIRRRINVGVFSDLNILVSLHKNDLNITHESKHIIDAITFSFSKSHIVKKLMDDYILLNKIGEGSFGRVYKARRKYTGRIVAIKMINKLGQTQDDFASFRREIDILKKVDHPNIMRMLDLKETNTDFCMISEMARGDLFQIISDNQTLPEEVLKSVSAQLVSALDHLHKQRIIHRDMKPQNILICANGALKVCDFGFARALSNTTLVLSSIKGTPLYMAPELVQEHHYDEKVDVWSLGIILYELYFGRTPFFTNSIYKLIQMIVNDSITWPKQISPVFQDFLSQMLQKDPLKRVSCSELLSHPFIASVPLDLYDDTGYRFKKQQFDEAIDESLSETASEPFQMPEDSALDYQSIVVNPADYTDNELNLTVKYIAQNEVSSDSPLSSSFALHFSEFVTRAGVAEEALKTATLLLKCDPDSFLPPFRDGLCILGSPDMPHSALDFLTEVLVVPHVLRLTNFVDIGSADFVLDDERAAKLRDKMLSYLFTSDPLEASRSYALLSYLSQVSPAFISAISRDAAAQVVPIVTAAAIRKAAPAISASAFVVLAKIIETNEDVIPYIQPITDFLNVLLTTLKIVPKTMEEFCVFSGAMAFLSRSFRIISQHSDFQRLSKGINHCELELFTQMYFRDDINELIDSLLVFAGEVPRNEEEHLCFVSMLESPFTHLSLTQEIVDKSISEIEKLLAMHQPALLRSVFGLPSSEIFYVLSSLIRLFDVTSCAEPLAKFLVETAKDLHDERFMSILVKENVMIKLSQMIAEYGPTTSSHVIELLVRIVLSIRKPIPELFEQAHGILRHILAVKKATEAALIIASHLVRISPEFTDVLEQCGTLNFAVKQLETGSAPIRARTLNLTGNICKCGPLRKDVSGKVMHLITESMCTDQDLVCRKYAAYAISCAVYHSPELGDIILSNIEGVIDLLKSSDAEAIDHAAAVICNMVRVDNRWLEALLQTNAIDQLVSAMDRLVSPMDRCPVARIVMKRIQMLCKYQEARIALKTHANRSVIQKYCKSQDETMKADAISINRLLDVM